MEIIEHFQRLLKQRLPQSKVIVDAPDHNHKDGNWWFDISLGKRRHTLEYRPGNGFGLFFDHVGYGEKPTEIYRTPDRIVERLMQLMASSSKRTTSLGLKDVRELYGHSQSELAKKAGIKQPAISRFEKRDEVKFKTLEAAIRALGGKLEIRAHFHDADIPISLQKG